MSVVFDLQDLGAASNTPATVLYDGSVVSSPDSCSFVAVNSVQLIGSIGYCRVTQTGSAWVVSTLPSGVRMTRLVGVAGEGVDCMVSTTGKVTFFAGRGPIAKFVPREALIEIAIKAGVKAGDAVFFACDQELKAAKLAGAARTRIGTELGFSKPGVFEFCWIVDFPMYEWNEDEKKVDFSHNPFSMPQGGLEALEGKDPLDILAYQYDIVCNGHELCSGAIRNHLPAIMYKAFEIAGYGPEVVESQFAGMLNAFKYGAPPHGGAAPGVDRIVMLLADEPNIREVITFPMNQQAVDLMMDAPTEVPPEKLRELHIALRLPPPKKD